jgi:hypothetical protein
MTGAAETLCSATGMWIVLPGRNCSISMITTYCRSGTSTISPTPISRKVGDGVLVDFFKNVECIPFRSDNRCLGRAVLRRRVWRLRGSAALPERGMYREWGDKKELNMYGCIPIQAW